MATHLAQKEVLDYREANCWAPPGMAETSFPKSIRFSKVFPRRRFSIGVQCFATYNKSRLGLRLENGETIVACVADHKPEVYSALSMVPHGRGKVILALGYFSCLRDINPGTKAEGEGKTPR